MRASVADPALPRELQVEITGACNLRCRMCLVRYRPPLDRATGSLPFRDYTNLVDSLPDLTTVTLQGLGEPLLHPDIVAMVDYAARRGITVGFNTNGSALTPGTAERLIDAGLGWLHISLDGATAATYERIRDGANFVRVCRNIGRLVDIKRARRAQKPSLRIVFVAMRTNVDELPALVRLTSELGVPELRVQNLSHSFDDCDPAGAYADIRRFAATEALWNADDLARATAAFSAAQDEAARLRVDLRLPSLHAHGAPARRARGERGCGWPWDSAYVTHDGIVQPCCMVMGSDRAAMGRVGDDGFAAVWHGDAYREFRRALLTDTPPEVCRGCSLYRGVF